MPIERPKGFVGFTIVWFGQVISLMGSAMSGFALTIWAWQITGQATALALMGFFSFGPTVLFSPIAGALVDRWNKKLVMMISDLAAGLSTIAILILYTSGHLQIWHMYVAGAFSGFFQAFQWPAYSSAISVMVPKAQYTRAAGMMSLAEWGSGIFAPVLAGALIGLIGIGPILWIDIATFIFAITALLIERHRGEDFQIRNMASIIETATETQNTMTILLGSIAAISLLVGGIGVMNIMLVSVTERTREIGIRMATGARMRNILQQFLIESLVVSALGGLIGVVAGLGVAAGIETLGTPVQYALPPVLLAFGCAFATGLVFGYLPAKKAAGLDPVVALASE